MAPIKVAVFPLVKNKPELLGKARSIYESIRLRHNAFWDVSGAIGKPIRSCFARKGRRWFQVVGVGGRAIGALRVPRAVFIGSLIVSTRAITIDSRNSGGLDGKREGYSRYPYLT